MKILQLWFGEKAPEHVLECMRHNQALGHEYCLCSHKNFLDADNFMCIDDVLRDSGIGEIVASMRHGNKLLATVDLLRIWLGSQERLLYLDADCMLTGHLGSLGDQAAFVLDKKTGLMLDYYAFYSGDGSFCAQMFASIVQNMNATGGYLDIESYRHINRHANAVLRFSAAFFEHLENRSWRNA
jgi:hypothetical protein